MREPIRGPDVEDSLRYHSRYDEPEGTSSSSSSSGEEQPEILVVTTDEVTRKETRLAQCNDWVEDWLGLNLTMLSLRVATAVWIITGIAVWTKIAQEEDQKDLITAMYLLVQIITTVGYGDVTPQSEGMMLFMAFYVLIGNVLTALVITERLQKMISRSQSMLKVKLRDGMAEASRTADHEPSSSGAKHESHHPAPFGQGALRALILYLFFLLVGALYYGLVDNCVCDKLDCNIESDCEDAGGRLRHRYESFYMACITLTTVGFGDELPTTTWGRFFGIFWMLFGVASMANFLAEMVHMILQGSMQSMIDHGLSHELFMKIDADGSGTLTKFEFITYMLVKYGLITESDLDTLCQEFEKFDKDKDGELTYEEILPPSSKRCSSSRRMKTTC